MAATKKKISKIEDGSDLILLEDGVSFEFVRDRLGKIVKDSNGVPLLREVRDSGAKLRLWEKKGGGK